MDTSFTWIKRITEIGLTLMPSKVAKERIDALMEGSVVHTEKVADLIDECAAAAEIFVEKNDDRVSAADKELISTLLGKTDGKEVVTTVEPDELASWVTDLKQSVQG